MDKLFLTVLNMSLTGAFVIAAICIARLPLKKAPKVISYCLWAVAGFRLAFPFSAESVFSLLPFNARPIPPDIATQAVPRIDSGIPLLNSAVSGVLPAAPPAASVNPLQVWTSIGAWVWVIGAAVMLLYGAASYISLKRKMRTAIRAGDNLYETDGVQSPFVLGILKPRIYIPLDLTGHEREYIILHERVHINRRDHIVKFAAYFILCLHWFNPLAWAAFLLVGVDMEMSCDERVLKELGNGVKEDYSRSLLSLSSRPLAGTLGPAARWPLAFSEGGLKGRIKNVLNFKKPSRVIIVAAVAFVTVLSAGFALNRIAASDELTVTIRLPAHDMLTATADLFSIDLVLGNDSWSGSAYEGEETFERLMSGLTIEDLPYVRNGERFGIRYEGSAPDSVTLTELILREDGRIKYKSSGKEYELSAKGTVTLEPNYATALSSNSWDYMEGNTVKGYRLLCAWGGNEYEFAFVLRGDPAIIMHRMGELRPPSETIDDPSPSPAVPPAADDSPPPPDARTHPITGEVLTREADMLREIYSLSDKYIPLWMQPFSVVDYDADGIPTIVEGGRLTGQDLIGRDDIDGLLNSTEEDMLVLPYIRAEYESHGFIQNIYYLNPDYPGEQRLSPEGWWPLWPEEPEEPLDTISRPRPR